jgi:NitT/TauT family transport system permease protein
MPQLIWNMMMSMSSGWFFFASEATSVGETTVTLPGIGSYIARATEAGDFHRVVLGIAVMSLFVVVINRTVWRPL